MIKLILIALFTVLFCSLNVFAQSDWTDSVSKTDKRKASEERDAPALPAANGVQNEETVGPLAQNTEYTSPAATESGPPTREEYNELRERMEMMESDMERIVGEQDELKERSLLDKLNWSGSYRFNFNFFHLTDHTFDKIPGHLVVTGISPTGDREMEAVERGKRNRDDWLAPSWTHRVKLSMTYDFGESLRFYSQLGVYKYFNETLNTIGVIDHGANAYPRDNAFRLERVYFDWFIADWLALSIGRIASPDGPPTELRENTERRSGWGVQMVNATIDTIMATFYLPKKMYLRTFYSPFGTHLNFAMNNEVSLFDDGGFDILHSWGAIFETAIPKMDDSIFQVGFWHIPKFSPRNTPIILPGATDLVYPTDPTGQDLGMFMQANALLQLNNIFNSGLDLFGAYSLTFLNPTEHTVTYNMKMTLDAFNPDGTPVMIGPPIPELQEQLTSTRTDSKQFGMASFEEGAGSKNFGHSIYAGFRYTLPFSETFPTRIGGEFNWGTRYHLAWSHANDQLLNKLGNKGLAFEGYLIQQMVPKHLFCRFGYLEIQRKFIGAFFGETNETDQKIRTIYFLVDLSW
ncbi:MAG: DUF3373 family protein [Deltaproteobacteria bacterium]|nr:DUF3373 family protein [Deltaproteobacteria bacterium]